MVKQYNSATIVAATMLAWGAKPDYFIYSPDVYGNTTYLGGWLTTADIGPDQLYSSAGAVTDNPVPLVWNGFIPYGTYHVNDPSIVCEQNGTLAMFVTALPNLYGDSPAQMMIYNQTALATSTNGGTSWTWDGIVIGMANGYDNTGAWSPSASVIGNNIDVWYHTGATDIVTGSVASSKVLLTKMNATGTDIVSTCVCYDTSTNAPLTTWNVDVKQAADGTYWMVSNDFNNNTIVAYESANGVNWTPWSTSGAILINAGDTGDQFNFLTPTILSVGNGQLNIMLAERIGGVDVEHTINFNLTNGAPTNDFLVSDVVNGIQGAYLPEAGAAYSGPITWLNNEFVYLGPENLNITALVPNVFLRSGSGMDGLNVSQVNGNNILDGGAGSNFLTGGTGDDTFYLDNRHPTTPVFSTIVKFHAGDNMTIWGVNPTDFSEMVLDNQGAPGYTGVDLIFTHPNQPAVSFVLAGYTSADLTNGRLSSSYGTTPDLRGLAGSQYLTIHGN